MAAANLPFYIDQCLRHRLFEVGDPGDAGAILIENDGTAICRVVTGGAETRTFEDADNFGVGQRLLVILDVAGGSLTLPGGVVLSSAGDSAEFVVTVANGAHAWILLSSTVTAGQADTSGIATIVETPDAQDAVDALLALSTALASAGIISDALTQAS